MYIFIGYAGKGLEGRRGAGRRRHQWRGGPQRKMTG